MKRIVANFLFMAAASSAAPTVFALGLGELTLNSALNQPLRAEIDLLDTGEYTEDQIRAALASYNEFERAGVDRPQFLTSIKFELDGDRLLLTTREAVNEPFLNFLIELNWPAGRVLREYTLLLDPPTFSESTVQPLVSSPALVEAQQPKPAQPARRPIPEYKNPAAERWSQPAAAGEYKVRTGDTLWSIASAQSAGTGITPHQMMVAIQQTNPSAFMNGNINQLKAHVVLDIPTASEVSAINSQVAATEVKRQNSEWSAGAAQLDATDKAADNAQSGRKSGSGEVRLLAANGTTDAARSGGLAEVGGGSETALEGDLAIALENLDKSRRENAELTERLQLLEGQLEKLERLVSLQNDELANMQGTSAEVLEAQVDEAMAAEAAVVADASATDTVDSEAAAIEAEGDLTAAVVSESAETTEVVTEEATAAAETPVAAAEKPKAEPKPAVTTPAAPKPDLAETLFRYKEFVLVGIGLVMALILALLAVRRRRLEDEDEDEFTAEDYEASDFEEGQTFQFEEMSEDDFITDPDNKKVDDETDDFLFAEDESTSETFDIGEDAAETSETSEIADDDEETTDVITQADHYIVYGKFDQAVKMLKDGSEEQPERTDIRLKLLELLATLDESDEFAQAEAGLVALGDDDANAQAAELRKQLSVQPAPVALADPDPLAVDAELANFSDDHSDEFADGIDFGDALDLPESDDKTSESGTVSDLDFMFDETPAEDTIAADEASSEDAAAEFEFSEGVATADEEETPVAEPQPPVFEQFPAAEYPREEDTAEAVTGPADEEELTFDLEADLTNDGELSAEVDLTETEATETEEVTLSDSTFDIDFADDDALELEDDQPAEETLLDNAPRVPELSLVSNEPEMPVAIEDIDDFREAPEFVDSSTDIQGNDFSAEEPLADLPPVDSAESDESDLTAGIDLDELETADDEFDFLSGTDECATKLDLARAYVDMEDFEGAKELLEEVVQEGSDQQKQDARDLMDKIA